MMRLRHSPSSPFVRKVMVALHETGLIDQVTLESGATTPFDSNPEVVAINPLGKIPCLVTPEGEGIYDSTVITRYLYGLHGGEKLYPTGAAEIPTLVLEATGNAMMEAGIAVVYEGRLREEGKRSEEWMAAQRAKIARALDALEGRKFADKLDIGQIALGCALGYLDFRFEAWDWRSGRPGLAAFARRMAKRPSFEATKPA